MAVALQSAFMLRCLMCIVLCIILCTSFFVSAKHSFGDKGVIHVYAHIFIYMHILAGTYYTNCTSLNRNICVSLIRDAHKQAIVLKILHGGHQTHHTAASMSRSRAPTQTTASPLTTRSELPRPLKGSGGPASANIKTPPSCSRREPPFT